MKNILNPLLFSLAFIVLGSCEKIIDVTVKDQEPSIVIEANVISNTTVHSVTVSRSSPLSATGPMEMVSSAEVILSDDIGNSERLEETSPGIYTSSSIAGMPGRTYHIDVIVGDKTFSATSYMHGVVTLDSIHFYEGIKMGGVFIYSAAQFNDEPGVRNYYRCVQYRNGTKVFSTLFNDDFANGSLNLQPLLNYETDFVYGDTVQLELEHVEYSVYRYYSALSENANNQSGAPANPPSNFDNGALGYFSAHAVSQKTQIIQR